MTGDQDKDGSTQADWEQWITDGGDGAALAKKPQLGFEFNDQQKNSQALSPAPPPSPTLQVPVHAP